MEGTTPRWRVARFDLPVNPVFDETLRGAGIETTTSPLPRSDEEVDRALAGAHVYHASSARNETAKFAFVTPALVERNRHLLAVSTYGAGYDSVDVEACTRAGIAVMNQAGANRFSVAEHAMGLILGITHRLAESDRLLRERRGFSREDLMGHEIGGMTLGLVGIGHVGTTVAQMAGAFRLDVWQPEPPALDNPLLKLPNVFATYHTAGVTHEARFNIARMGSEQIVHMFRGERPPRLVNPEVWPEFQRRFAEQKERR